MLEDIRFDALHQFHIILSEFKGSPLKIHVSWWTRYHKTEIYVNDMTIDIDKDVVVMSILDVKQKLDQTISC
jgi:hypothetical protein